MSVQTLERELRCGDGVGLPATVFAPPAPQRALVMASAMGVPRQFYRRFAEFLATQSIATITFDYRGIGDAAGAAADPATTRLEDWGRYDLDAAISEAARAFPGLPLLLAGHSCGGQLPGLAASVSKLRGIVFIAASSPQLTHWRGAGRPAIEFFARVVIPLATLGRWFPARRLKFSTLDIPAGVVRQWGQWLRGPRYLFSPQFGLDLSRYPQLKLPALCFSFSDDSFAPRAGADALLAEYPALTVARRHVAPSDVGARGIGHLGFFRDSLRGSLWADTVKWAKENT